MTFHGGFRRSLLSVAKKTKNQRLFQNEAFFKNNIPSSDSDVGAKGYGIVVFEAVTTIPYSGLFIKPSKSSELFEG